MTNEGDGILVVGKIIGSLPISYNGGKKPIFHWVAGTLCREAIGHHRVLDGFSGTGIMSAMLSAIGMETYSCDPLQTAYCMSVTLAQNDGDILSGDDLDGLCSHRTVDGIVYDGSDVIDGMWSLAESFRGCLTRNECAWLTMANHKLSTLSPHKQMIGQCAIRAICCLQPYGTPHGSETFRHRIKQKDKYGDDCLGHYMNSSYEIEVGVWFRKYCEKFSEAVRQMSAVRESSATCYRADVIAAIEEWDWLSDVEMAYFDPPYGRRQRGYATDYGLSEALLGGEALPFSDFDTVDGHERNFHRLLDASSGMDKIVFSYDDKSWKTIPEIVGEVERHGRRVRIESLPHVHGKRPNARCQKRVEEHLIIAERKGAKCRSRSRGRS